MSKKLIYNDGFGNKKIVASRDSLTAAEIKLLDNGQASLREGSDEEVKNIQSKLDKEAKRHKDNPGVAKGAQDASIQRSEQGIHAGTMGAAPQLLSRAQMEENEGEEFNEDQHRTDNAAAATSRSLDATAHLGQSARDQQEEDARVEKEGVKKEDPKAGEKEVGKAAGNIEKSADKK